MSDAESQARSETAALIRRYYEAFNAGDSAGMIACLTDDVIHDVNQGERRTGLDKFKAFNARMDHHYQEKLENIVVLVSKDGQRAAAEFNVHGVYKATDSGLPDAKGQTVCPARRHLLRHPRRQDRPRHHILQPDRLDRAGHRLSRLRQVGSKRNARHAC